MGIEETWKGLKISQCLIRTRICSCNLNGHMTDQRDKEGRETLTFPVGLCKMKETVLWYYLHRKRMEKMYD